MPKYRKLALDLINEPALPVRAAMDVGKLAELKESMAELGLLHPISVESVDGRYEIRAGHRRFLAAKELGWTEIAAMVYEPGEKPPQAIKLHENIMHEELSAGEEALFFAQLNENYENDFEGLCKAVRRTEDYVSDRLRLLRGDDEVFRALLQRRIGFGVARELNKIEQEALRRMYLSIAVTGGCTYTMAAGWVAKAKEFGLWKDPAPQTPQPEVAAPTAEPQRVACWLCNGDKDPYNLRWVQMHYFCIERIEKLIKGAEEGGG